MQLVKECFVKYILSDGFSYFLYSELRFEATTCFGLLTSCPAPQCLTKNLVKVGPG